MTRLPGPRPGAGPAALEALLAGPLSVVSLGLAAFAEDLLAAGVPVVAVDWRPPAGGDPQLARLLVALDDDEEDVGPPGGERA